MNRIILICTSIISFLITCCCVSCKQSVYEELQTFIKNETDSLIHVTLYPKITDITLYPICEGCGTYQNVEFSLPSNNERVLFVTKDIDIKPYTLILTTFDSIHVSLTNKDSVIIKFTHENVTGYSENIFFENSTWDFVIDEYDAPTELRKNPVRDYIYTFKISEDNLINKFDSDE